jgi:ketosteroid isomerase-like protein
MSAENVEVVRASFDAWRAGDFEKSLSYYAEDAAWQTGPLDTAVYCGRKGVAQAVEAWVGAFTGYWLETDELIDAGDKVVLLAREGGTGKASGVPVEEEAAMVFTVTDGQITRARGYTDRAEALAAAGVEQPLHGS